MKALVLKMDAKTDDVVYLRAVDLINHPSCISFRIISLDNTDECVMGSIREEVADFMSRDPILERLEGDRWYAMEDALVDFIYNILGGRN